METRPLHLLLADASADDAERTLAALRASALRFKPRRVSDRAGLRAAVDAGGWDAIVTEHAPPQLDAALVLDALRDANLDVPLLVLTHAIAGADLAALMRAGARDVILKSELARLPPALERELAVAAERAQHRAALQALREMEQKHRTIVQGALEAVCYCQDGMHIDANPAYLELFGYASIAELEGVPVLDLIDKRDHARFKQHMRSSRDGPGASQEFAAVRKNGERFHAAAAVARVSINGEACTQLLVTDISKRVAAETRLQYLNQHDPLTGLYNRNYFLKRLHEAVARAAHERASCGVVYLDLHDLRKVIRTLGHAAADRFLLAAARELRALFGTTACVARYGDHEFAVLSPETRPEQLRDLVARLRRALAAALPRESGLPGEFGYHVSGAPVTAQTKNTQSVMAALYPGGEPPARIQEPPSPPFPPGPPPRPGANPSPQSPQPSTRAGAEPGDSDWQKRIAQAIARGAFRLIYQPIVNLRADPAEYFEVLVRMIGDEGALIPAAAFIPRAEETGQALAIDRWVIERAIRTLAELRRQGRKVTFFVNLSAQALRDPELVLVAGHALNESRLSGRYLVFEIDEAALLGARDAALAFMHAVERIGCHVCIDNFGRAAPAANAARPGPIEYLKLDGGAALNLPGDPVAQASLRALVEVAQAMNKKTIAKSVESAESLSVLWALGVDYVQGHYFQEGDAELNYQFEDQATLSSEHVPSWALAPSNKSR